MRRMCQVLARFLKRDDGPTAVEYAVLISLVLLVCIGAVNSVGNAVSGSVQASSDKIGSATGGSDSGGSGSSSASSAAAASSSSSASGGGKGTSGGGKGAGRGRGS